MKHPITAVLIALLSVSGATHATEANYCADPRQDHQWQLRLAKYPGDPLVQKLFALRKGLCSMVAEGLLELSAAAQLFANEQGQSVMQRMEDEAQQNPYRSL
jgi:hypothetical protein